MSTRGKNQNETQFRTTLRIPQSKKRLFSFFYQSRAATINVNQLICDILEDSITTGRAFDIKNTLTRKRKSTTLTLDDNNEITQEIKRLREIVDLLSRQQKKNTDEATLTTGIQLINPTKQDSKPQEPKEIWTAKDQSINTNNNANNQAIQEKRPNKTIQKALKHIYMDSEFRAEVEARHGINQNSAQEIAETSATLGDDTEPRALITGIVYLTEEEEDAL